MNNDERWERDVLRDIALEGIRERRRSRRWGIFFKILLFAYLLALLALALSGPWFAGDDGLGPHTAVVDIHGPILPASPASAERVTAALQNAFAAEGVRGVLLRINSPGGSPVQAGRINDEIRRLRGLHPDVPVYAVAGDICASGAYYVAVAADRIYADKASIVGSIGVILGSFGFTGAMDKLGIERRLYTAGRNKAFLDPFSPQHPDEVRRIEQMLDAVHQQFIAVVRAGRGERLADDAEIFSGLVWTGTQSVELGLVDALGSPEYVAREVIGAQAMVNYTVEGTLLERVARRIGASFGHALGAMIGLGGAPMR